MIAGQQRAHQGLAGERAADSRQPAHGTRDTARRLN